MQETWETWVWSLGQKIPWRRAWQPTPVFLPGESHGQRSLVGYSPQGHEESDTPDAHPSLSKMDSNKKTCEYSIPWHHFPFDLQGAFLCMCGWGDLLTLRMRNTWYDRAQSLPLIVLLFSSWSFSPWEMNLQLLYPQKWEKRQLNPSSIWQDCQRVTEFHIIRLDNGSIRGKLWAKLGNVGIGWAKRIN